MYYLFMTKQSELDTYKAKLLKVKANIAEGKTPVYSELRAAKSNMVESLPYNSIQAVLMVIVTVAMSKVELNELFRMALLLVVNNLCGAVSNYLFTVGKHCLRVKLCKRLKIEPTEENIAAMESLEYQTV